MKSKLMLLLEDLTKKIGIAVDLKIEKIKFDGTQDEYNQAVSSALGK